jgi:tRNA pseudouridine13 synthase
MALTFLPSPETFFVQEIPLFEASGEGAHLFLRIRKAGLSTPAVLRELERGLGLPEKEVGYAGFKDRDSTSEQTISLPARCRESAAHVLDRIGVEILSAELHPHKLRTGKLRGNRFRAILSCQTSEDLHVLKAGCARLTLEGLPNAFGPQRFGDGGAAGLGREIFLGLRPGKSFRRTRFAVSAFQAAIFNRVLEIRRRERLFPGPVNGDLMKRHDSGGLFLLDTVDDESARRTEKFEISPTGPLPGKKMRRPEGLALQVEEAALAEQGVSSFQCGIAKAPGTRRFLRVPVLDLQMKLEVGRSVLEFTLPPGSYASVLMSEAGIEVLAPPEAH